MFDHQTFETAALLLVVILAQAVGWLLLFESLLAVSPLGFAAALAYLAVQHRWGSVRPGWRGHVGRAGPAYATALFVLVAMGFLDGDNWGYLFFLQPALLGSAGWVAGDLVWTGVHTRA